MDPLFLQFGSLDLALWPNPVEKIIRLIIELTLNFYFLRFLKVIVFYRLWKRVSIVYKFDVFDSLKGSRKLWMSLFLLFVGSCSLFSVFMRVNARLQAQGLAQGTAIRHHPIKRLRVDKVSSSVRTINLLLGKGFTFTQANKWASLKSSDNYLARAHEP